MFLSIHITCLWSIHRLPFLMTATLFSARFNIHLILDGKPHTADLLTKLWAGRSEIRFLEGIREFLFLKPSLSALESTLPPIEWDTGVSFYGDRAAEVWSWPLSSIWYQGDEREGLCVSCTLMPFVECRGKTSPWLLPLRFQSEPHHRLAVVNVVVRREWRRKVVQIVNTCSDNNAVVNNGV